MENTLKGMQAVGNSKPHREQFIPYAVIDTRTGIEIFQGSSKECSDYAMDVENGRIPSYLAIVCIG